MNGIENNGNVRESLSFEQLKQLCVWYKKEIMENDYSVQKVHFMDRGNGNITVFYEDNNSALYKIKELSYNYPDCCQRNGLAVKAKEFIGDSYTISLESRYANAPCFTISKPIHMA